ncbi:hypothetical protein COO09_13020 [Rhizorhabdus dicambivorans]|uniref:Lipoprotein n=1 Tax=Rhizorhabdus dicambivorans TaxID=1850238 RepID=A0A2A4FW97_9SPHN|nr:hypothetical protein CMV14_15265 [Rhizorhabdus dicambivorans]PCE41966.1 hypothetical protein COO09_13020 [Rhizorhabdus dicambivorans]
MGVGKSLGLAALLLLAACGSAKDDATGDPIDCRLADAPRFERICTIDRVDSPDGRVIVARGPDGGFRRLLIVKDGRGVIAADGAVPVTVRPSDEPGHIEVAAGEMVYRLPAKVAP